MNLVKKIQTLSLFIVTISSLGVMGSLHAVDDEYGNPIGKQPDGTVIKAVEQADGSSGYETTDPKTGLILKVDEYGADGKYRGTTSNDYETSKYKFEGIDGSSETGALK